MTILWITLGLFGAFVFTAVFLLVRPYPRPTRPGHPEDHHHG